MAYLDPEELNEWICRWQAGDFDPAIMDAISALVRKSEGTPDDAQDVLLELLKALPRLDPKRNIFSYLTDIVITTILLRRRKTAAYVRFLASVSQMMYTPDRFGGRRGEARFLWRK